MTKNSGYTIVEVMIFLAVSGFMFVLAAVFVNGKQASAEFKQGMNDANSNIMGIIGDVADGYFPSNKLICSAGGSGSPTIRTPSAGETSEQGSNKGCVFLGKVLQFGVDGTSGAGYNIYTVAGRQYASEPAVATNFTQAQPVAADSLTEQKGLQWGLTVTGMYDEKTDKRIGAVGFFTSFGSYSQSTGVLASGSQTATVVVLPGSSLNESESNLVDLINTTTGATYDKTVEAQPDIVICLTGGNNRKGSIRIGGDSGQRLTTDMQMGELVDSKCLS